MENIQFSFFRNLVEDVSINGASLTEDQKDKLAYRFINDKYFWQDFDTAFQEVVEEFISDEKLIDKM